MNRHKHRGVAVVELALILPVFMLLTLGMIEFGQLVKVKQQLVSASYTCARIQASESDSGQLSERAKLVTNASFWGLKEPEKGIVWSNINCPAPDALQITVDTLSPLVNQQRPIKVTLTVAYRDAVWPPMLNKLIPPEVTAATTVSKERHTL